MFSYLVKGFVFWEI